jgi:hypothetical protein
MARKKRPRIQDTRTFLLAMNACQPEFWERYIMLIKMVEGVSEMNDSCRKEWKTT